MPGPPAATGTRDTYPSARAEVPGKTRQREPSAAVCRIEAVVSGDARTLTGTFRQRAGLPADSTVGNSARRVATTLLRVRCVETEKAPRIGQYDETTHASCRTVTAEEKTIFGSCKVGVLSHDCEANYSMCQSGLKATFGDSARQPPRSMRRAASRGKKRGRSVVEASAPALPAASKAMEELVVAFCVRRLFEQSRVWPQRLRASDGSAHDCNLGATANFAVCGGLPGRRATAA